MIFQDSCGTGALSLVAKVRERLVVSNEQHRSLMWRDINIKKPNELQVRNQY